MHLGGLLVCQAHIAFTSMTPIQRRRILAQLFTRPVFSLLSKTDGAQAALSFLTAAGVASRLGNQSAASIFEAAFAELNDGYRNEYIYKATLANRIVFGKHNPKTTSMQVELPVGRSIVDVAVFNGTSTAYEIKTEFDTPKRLLSQSSDYLRAFDHVYVVTHPHLAERYASLVDDRVGIAAITGRNSIRVLRSAADNAGHIDARAVFRMLRRSEYIDAVESIFGKLPSIPNGLIFKHCEELFKTLPSEQAHKLFVSALRRRTTDAATVDFLSHLPTSLRVLGYATPLSGVARERIISSLASQVRLTLR